MTAAATPRTSLRSRWRRACRRPPSRTRRTTTSREALTVAAAPDERVGRLLEPDEVDAGGEPGEHRRGERAGEAVVLGRVRGEDEDVRRARDASARRRRPGQPRSIAAPARPRPPAVSAVVDRRPSSGWSRIVMLAEPAPARRPASDAPIEIRSRSWLRGRGHGDALVRLRHAGHLVRAWPAPFTDVRGHGRPRDPGLGERASGRAPTSTRRDRRRGRGSRRPRRCSRRAALSAWTSTLPPAVTTAWSMNASVIESAT